MPRQTRKGSGQGRAKANNARDDRMGPYKPSVFSPPRTTRATTSPTEDTNRPVRPDGSQGGADPLAANGGQPAARSCTGEAPTPTARTSETSSNTTTAVTTANSEDNTDAATVTPANCNRSTVQEGLHVAGDLMQVSPTEAQGSPARNSADETPPQEDNSTSMEEEDGKPHAEDHNSRKKVSFPDEESCTKEAMEKDDNDRMYVTARPKEPTMPSTWLGFCRTPKAFQETASTQGYASPTGDYSEKLQRMHNTFSLAHQQLPDVNSPIFWNKLFRRAMGSKKGSLNDQQWWAPLEPHKQDIREFMIGLVKTHPSIFEKEWEEESGKLLVNEATAPWAGAFLIFGAVWQQFPSPEELQKERNRGRTLEEAPTNDLQRKLADMPFKEAKLRPTPKPNPVETINQGAGENLTKIQIYESYLLGKSAFIAAESFKPADQATALSTILRKSIDKLKAADPDYGMLKQLENEYQDSSRQLYRIKVSKLGTQENYLPTSSNELRKYMGIGRITHNEAPRYFRLRVLHSVSLETLLCKMNEPDADVTSEEQRYSFFMAPLQTSKPVPVGRIYGLPPKIINKGRLAVEFEKQHALLMDGEDIQVELRNVIGDYKAKDLDYDTKFVLQLETLPEFVPQVCRTAEAIYSPNRTHGHPLNIPGTFVPSARAKPSQASDLEQQHNRYWLTHLNCLKSLSYGHFQGYANLYEQVQGLPTCLHSLIMGIRSMPPEGSNLPTDRALFQAISPYASANDSDTVAYAVLQEDAAEATEVIKLLPHILRANVNSTTVLKNINLSTLRELNRVVKLDSDGVWKVWRRDENSMRQMQLREGLSSAESILTRIKNQPLSISKKLRVRTRFTELFTEGTMESASTVASTGLEDDSITTAPEGNPQAAAEGLDNASDHTTIVTTGLSIESTERGGPTRQYQIPLYVDYSHTAMEAMDDDTTVGGSVIELMDSEDEDTEMEETSTQETTLQTLKPNQIFIPPDDPPHRVPLEVIAETMGLDQQQFDQPGDFLSRVPFKTRLDRIVSLTKHWENTRGVAEAFDREFHLWSMNCNRKWAHILEQNETFPKFDDIRMGRSLESIYKAKWICAGGDFLPREFFASIKHLQDLQDSDLTDPLKIIQIGSWMDFYLGNAVNLFIMLAKDMPTNNSNTANKSPPRKKSRGATAEDRQGARG